MAEAIAEILFPEFCEFILHYLCKETFLLPVTDFDVNGFEWTLFAEIFNNVCQALTHGWLLQLKLKTL